MRRPTGLNPRRTRHGDVPQRSVLVQHSYVAAELRWQRQVRVEPIFATAAKDQAWKL